MPPALARPRPGGAWDGVLPMLRATSRHEGETVMRFVQIVEYATSRPDEMFDEHYVASGG